MKHWKQTILLGCLATLTIPAALALTPGDVSHTCRKPLSVSDARLLAAATPNARAFQSNLGAKLKTAIAGTHRDGSVDVRVTAESGAEPVQDVGTYSVNLRTGHVLDDDQEPAEDAATLKVREKLFQAHHCSE